MVGGRPNDSSHGVSSGTCWRSPPESCAAGASTWKGAPVAKNQKKQEKGGEIRKNIKEKTQREEEKKKKRKEEILIKEEQRRKNKKQRKKDK